MKGFRFEQIQKGKLVLEALFNHGVLDTKTLKYLIPEFKDRRNLLRTLKNLCHKGLVVERYKKVQGGQAVFYQLNQKSYIREALATYLDKQSDDLLQRDYRFSELFHEQLIAKIAYHLRQKYPEALLIRERKIASHPEAQSIFIGFDDFQTPKPDILLILKIGENKKVVIAIEYERTAKSKKRLAEKLNYYTKRTSIDGVLYLYDESRIDHNLHEVFLDKILRRSFRINKYGRNFLLTSCIENDVEKSLTLLKNREEKYYPIDHWIQTFTTCSAHSRTDENFKTLP